MYHYHTFEDPKTYDGYACCWGQDLGFSFNLEYTCLEALVDWLSKLSPSQLARVEEGANEDFNPQSNASGAMTSPSVSHKL